MVQVRVIISCQKCDSKNGCFWDKNGLTKTVAAAKVAIFLNGFHFELMRDEAKKFSYCLVYYLAIRHHSDF